MLGLMRLASLKVEEFRDEAAAAAVEPPAQLIGAAVALAAAEAAASAWATKAPLSGAMAAGAAAASEAARVLDTLGALQLAAAADTPLLRGAVAELHVLLGSSAEAGATAADVATSLMRAFPPSALDAALNRYTADAWAALGPCTLEVRHLRASVRHINPRLPRPASGHHNYPLLA